MPLPPGSGSTSNACPFVVVTGEEEPDTNIVHHDGLGKGEGFAHEPPKTLAQGVVAALDKGSLAALLADPCMLVGRKRRGIGLPKIMETMGQTVGLRNSVPQLATGRHRAVADGVGDDLPGASAQGEPEPGLIELAEDE
jgi:hypothetical protein